MKHLKNNLTAVLLVASFALLVLTQCKPENNSKKLLSQALKNKDYATAAFAYNNLLLEDSTNLDYKDSLARIYIRSGNFEGGLRLGEQVIAKRPGNSKLLELISVANGQLKNIDKSIANLNTLFTTTKDYTYLYKISGVYFDNGQFQKADSVCDKVIEFADSSKNVEINLPNGSSQSVPILAACYNMKGAILTEMAEISQDGELVRKSIPYFQKAMQMAPDFAYPRLYLEKIAQFMQQQQR
jgi:tetratricopeptide (TPR) repeat protein